MGGSVEFQPVDYDPFAPPAEGPPTTLQQSPSAWDIISKWAGTTWPVRVAQNMLQAAQAPHDVMVGKLDPNSDEAIARMADLAGGLGFVGTATAPLREGASAGIFGGQLAEKLPQGVLDVPNRQNLPPLTMLGKLRDAAGSQEVTRPVIPDDNMEMWRNTGWHIGADGAPRFEINDSPAKMTEGLTPGVQYTLDEVLHHPDLFAAYPGLKDMKVSFSKMYPNLRGEYSPGLNTIRLNAADSQPEQISTLLHEVQHGVQNKEGFAPGGSPNYRALPLSGPERAAMQDYVTLRDRKDALSPAESTYADQLDTWLGRRAKVDKHLNDAQFENYQGLFGETEARNVQARFKDNAYDTHPMDTEFPQRPDQHMYQPSQADTIKRVYKEQNFPDDYLSVPQRPAQKPRVLTPDDLPDPGAPKRPPYVPPLRPVAPRPAPPPYVPPAAPKKTPFPIVPPWGKKP